MSDVFLKIHNGDPGPNMNRHLIEGTGLPRTYSLTNGGDAYWSTLSVHTLDIQAVTMWDCTGRTALQILDLPTPVHGHTITFCAELMDQALAGFRAALDELRHAEPMTLTKLALAP